MPIAGPPAPPTGPAGPPAAGARNIEAGLLLIGAGAILLFVSLFLEWYQPGIDAWEIFEVWDLVLALLAVVALAGVASRLGFAAPRPASWLVGPAGAALVIVLFNLLNPPPLTPQIDGDPGAGLWLALAAAVLMAGGALLSVARISVAFAPAEPLAPGAVGPRGPGRFGRSRATEPVDPAAPAPAPGAAPPPPAVGEPGPTTEPTRRL